MLPAPSGFLPMLLALQSAGVGAASTPHCLARLPALRHLPPQCARHLGSPSACAGDSRGRVSLLAGLYCCRVRPTSFTFKRSRAMLLLNASGGGGAHRVDQRLLAQSQTREWQGIGSSRCATVFTWQRARTCGSSWTGIHSFVARFSSGTRASCTIRINVVVLPTSPAAALLERWPG
jgi:hypothetical protein